MTRAEIVALLFSIVSEPNDREGKIRAFQDSVFNARELPWGFYDREWEIMQDLAYDLDFYQESYGGERLNREIQDCIAKLSST